MKRLVLALLPVVACAWGQVVYQVDTTIIEWDAVATYENGATFPAGAVVTYEIGYSVLPVADRTTPTTILGATGSSDAQVTVPGFSQYAYAARTVVVSPTGTEYSVWVWSDIDGYPGPWVVTKVPLANPPKKPPRIRVR